MNERLAGWSANPAPRPPPGPTLPPSLTPLSSHSPSPCVQTLVWLVLETGSCCVSHESTSESKTALHRGSHRGLKNQ